MANIVFPNLADQAQTQEELRRKADHLAALYEASQLFLGQRDSGAILESACRLAVDRFGLAMAWVGLIQGGNFDVAPFFVYGVGEKYPESVQITWDDSPTGQGPSGRAVRTGRAAVTNRIETDPAYAPWREAALARGYHSSAALPLLGDDRVLGVMNVYSTQADHFTDEQVQVLQSLTNQAAIAIENARLYEETRHHNRELLLLNRIMAISAAAVDQDIRAVLQAICHELARGFDVSRTAAALLDREASRAEIVAEYGGAGQPTALGQTVPLADNLAFQYLAEHKAPLLANDALAEPRLAPIHEILRAWGASAALLLPLLIEGQILGGLVLAATRPRTFTAEEVGLASRVSEQVSDILARLRLMETQQRLSTAVEQAAESVVIADTQGAIVYVNPAFERISGHHREQVVGRKLDFLGWSERVAASSRSLWQTLALGQVWQGRFVSRRKDGTSYTQEATIAPVRNPSGEIVSYIATLRDVTREVQLEEQFRRSQKMEAIGRLAGGIAHDFNNLLTVIHLSVRLMEHKLEPENPLWENVQRIGEAGERATQLVKQLLTFSRREIVETQILDLNRIVSDVSRMLQRIIGEDVQLKIDLADDLWQVAVDPSQMEQVIMNLAVNARDAMPQGGILAIQTANVVLDEVYAALHMDVKPGEYVVMTVSDTGIGMDSEVKSHLFEPFFTTKERGKGTGLGLATVFGIVKRSRGHIQVYSEVGYGTTFRIYFPRVSRPALDSDIMADSFGGRAEREAGARFAPAVAAQSDAMRDIETILLVEDDASVRELAVDILRSHGYRVLPAKNGTEALQLSLQHDGAIHLLLTDVVLPETGGRELADVLLRHRPAMKVLFTSGYTQETIASHGVLAEEIFFLSKPLTLTSLIQKVREVLAPGA